MMGLYNLIDQAMANALDVDVNTYIDVIENKCTDEEAEFIINTFWNEDVDNEAAAKELFEKCKQK